jgi:hypothetical protein
VPILFIALFIIIAEYFISNNTTFEEWDGVMQLYSGINLFDNKIYSGWPSHFWPPLYSMLLGIINEFGGGLFEFRQISLFSGVFLLSMIVFLSKKYNVFNVGLLSILIGFLATNWTFISSSVQVENHMLDTTLFLSSMGCLFAYAKRNEKKFGILSGIFAGLACNTRYTSYILIFIPFFYCFIWRLIDKKLILLFFSSFLIVCLPWWFQNYITNGFPLHTWQYLNIGSSVYSKSEVDWWWIKSSDYHSLFDILKSDFYLYIKNFLKNIIYSIFITFKVSSGLVILALYGLTFRASEIDDFNLKFMRLITLVYMVFFILVSQAFVFDQVFLTWGIIFSIMGIYFARNIKIKGMEVFLIIIIIAISIFSFSKIYHWSKDLDDSGQLAYPDLVKTILLEDGACEINNFNSCRIIAIHPERARSLGLSYSALPIGKGISLDDVLNYKNLNSKIVEYAPKWPITPYEDVKNEFFIITDLKKSFYSPWAANFKIDQCPSGLRCYMPNDDLLIIKRK